MKRAEAAKGKRRPGRPKKYRVVLRKSLERDISLSTAAYSKARMRVSMERIEEVFEESKIAEPNNDYSHWEGYRVMIADGTYVQMQDAESISADYEVKKKGEAGEAYPQGLLEVLIDRGGKGT